MRTRLRAGIWSTAVRRAVALVVLVALTAATARGLQAPGQQKGEFDKAMALDMEAVRLQGEGKYDEAARLASQSLDIVRAAYGPDHPMTAGPTAILAGIYSGKGDYARALPLFEQALAINEKAFGPEHPLVSITLVGFAIAVEDSGDDVKAEALFRRAVAIVEKAVGPEAPDLVTPLTGLARTLAAAARYREAETILDRAIAIDETKAGPDSAEMSTLLVMRASLFERLGDYAKAEPPARRAVEIRERLFGREHPNVAAALATLATIVYKKGDYAAAEPLFERALAISEKAFGPEHPAVAAALHNLATLLDDMGNLGRARALHERALAIREKIFGPEHRETAVSLAGLGFVADHEGDYRQAIRYFERALAVNERALGPNHPSVAMGLNNVASVHRTAGEYVEAERQYSRALEIYERAGLSRTTDAANTIDNLAILYHVRGDYARAEAMFERALAVHEEVLGRDHTSVGIDLNNLGMAAAQRGDAVKARAHFERALAIFEAALGPGSSLSATALNNLANLDLERGDLDAAEALFKRILATREKTLGPDHVETATIVNNLASVYDGKRDRARAEALYLRALATFEKALGPTHPQVASTLMNMVALYAGAGSMEKAVDLLARANAIREQNIGYTIAAGSEQQKRLFMATLANETDATISLHIQYAPHDARARDLALTTLLQRKGRALDAMTDALGALRRSLSPEDRELLERFDAARSRLAGFVLGGGAAAEREARIRELQQTVDSLEHEASERTVASAAFRAVVEPVSIQVVRSAIPSGAALVEFASYRPYDPTAASGSRFGPSRYAAYVLAPAGEPAWVDLGAAAAVDAAAGRLREALRNPKRVDVKRFARVLDDLVMRPVRPLLGQARSVLLSPDGSLNLVPFAALVDERGDYLVSHFSFTYLTTGRDLLRLQVRGKASGGTVIVAAPDFGDRVVQAGPLANARFAPLPGTAREAKALGELLPGASVMTGRQATESALKSLRGPAILHVATHGFFLEDTRRSDVQAGASRLLVHQGEASVVEVANPLLRSGIALAGANGGEGGEDGILTALEAAGLDLSGTRLVVLSACDTGVGEVSNGEGVYGLRRALVLAGSESQVMSLWPVSDRATSELMVAFYRGLRDGQGRGDALRNVQLRMLESPATSHPYYWASFIESGDWRPVERGTLTGGVR